jgi:hypothetical protein
LSASLSACPPLPPALLHLPASCALVWVSGSETKCTRALPRVGVWRASWLPLRPLHAPQLDPSPNPPLCARPQAGACIAGGVLASPSNLATWLQPATGRSAPLHQTRCTPFPIAPRRPPNSVFTRSRCPSVFHPGDPLFGPFATIVCDVAPSPPPFRADTALSMH